MVKEAAFTILLTFMVGPDGPNAWTLYCPTQACVDKVIAASAKSTRLVRLRVFKGNPGNLGYGAATEVPILDEWLQ